MHLLQFLNYQGVQLNTYIIIHTTYSAAVTKYIYDPFTYVQYIIYISGFQTFSGPKEKVQHRGNFLFVETSKHKGISTRVNQ